MHRRTVLAGALALLAEQARAHSWYDPFCCNGKDCQPVPDGAVVATRNGWFVRLMPGDHPEVTKPVSELVPFKDAKPSEDGAFHVCIFPKNVVRCLYTPPGGV